MHVLTFITIVSITQIILADLPHTSYVQNNYFVGRKLQSTPIYIRQNNTTVTIIDPLIKFNKPGILILRKAGYEINAIITKQKLHFFIPSELTYTEGSIQLLYLGKNDQLIKTEFSLPVKDICNKINCYFCLQYIKHIRCYSTLLAYFLTVMIFATLVLFISTLRIICEFIINLIYLIKVGKNMTKQIIKIVIKTLTKLGLFIACILQNYFIKVAKIVVRYQRKIIPVNPVVIILGLILIVACSADQTNQHECDNIIAQNTKLKNCRNIYDRKTCQLQEQTRITIPNLGHTTCIEFYEKTKHILTMKLTLLDVKCDWYTKHLYYTSTSTVTLINDFQCGLPGLCDNTLCVPGQTYLVHSGEYPHVENCFQAESLIYNCVKILDSIYLPCLYYSWQIKPDKNKVHSVREIQSNTCYPVLLYKISTDLYEKETKIENKVFIDNYTEITALGSYLKHSDFLTKQIVIPVKPNIDEAYLVNTAPKGMPTRGRIGDIQMELPNSTSFLFDSGIADCNLFEKTVNCKIQQSYLKNMLKQKEERLPHRYGNHQLYLTPNGQIQSLMLQINSVNVNIKHKGTAVMILNKEVCPAIIEVNKISGCHNCEVYSIILIEAQSTCQEGNVRVELNFSSNHDQTIFLKKQVQSYSIKFKITAKCFNGKIKLIADHSFSEKEIFGCLEEPTYKLYTLNHSIISATINQTKLTLPEVNFDWVPTIPNPFKIVTNIFTTIYEIIKYGLIMLAVFLVGMVILICFQQKRIIIDQLNNI